MLLYECSEWLSGKRKFSCICIGATSTSLSLYSCTVESEKVMHALTTVLKKYIEREVTFVFNDFAEYFSLTAILHSRTRIPQVLFWIITNCITDVNLPWQQPNRCKVWCHFYSTSTLYISYIRVQTEESQPNFWDLVVCSPFQYQNGLCPFCKVNIVVIRT